MAIDQVRQRITSILYDASLSRSEKRDILKSIQERLDNIRPRKLFEFNPEEIKPELLPIDGDVIKLDESDDSYQSRRATRAADTVREGGLAAEVEQVDSQENQDQETKEPGLDGRTLLATA